MLNPWPYTLSVAVALATLASPAPVQAQELSFNLPAGPLGNTLNAIASQSGQIVSLEPALVQGKQAPAVIGRMSPEQAMNRALSGSQLQLRITGQGNFSVEPAAQDSGALQLGVTSIVERSLDPTSEGSGSYTPRTVTIGKGAHTLKETPQSVTVITRKMLDDQNLNTIEQVMEKTPGITVYDSPMGGKYFYSRGFRMTGQYQYDGVPLDIGSSYVQADSFSSDMAIYDRVEVLRGAAGMMKGAGGTAGAVNFVRKRGEYTPHTQLSLSAGTWDNYRGQIDTGGPLNEDGTLRGRAVVTQQTRQYFYDIGDRKDQIYYGALDYDLSPDTTVGVGIAYEDVDATPCWGGLPRYADGSDLKLKRSTCLNTAWNQQRSQRTR